MRGRLHPGQLSSPSQGKIKKIVHTHIHTYDSVLGDTVADVVSAPALQQERLLVGPQVKTLDPPRIFPPKSQRNESLTSGFKQTARGQSSDFQNGRGHGGHCPPAEGRRLQRRSAPDHFTLTTVTKLYWESNQQLTPLALRQSSHSEKVCRVDDVTGI